MWVEEASTVDISNITRFFTNQQYDKESGLYYYNARYYDPHLGSFITPDPAMQHFNHYAYSSANPIKYTDPTGLLDGPANTTTDEDETKTESTKNNKQKETKTEQETNKKNKDDQNKEKPLFSEIKELQLKLKTDKSLTKKEQDEIVSKIKELADPKNRDSGAINLDPTIFSLVLMGLGGVSALELISGIKIVKSIADNTKNKYSRFMSKAELKVVKEKGLLRGGNPGKTYFTTNKFRTMTKAQEKLSLKEPPEVRVDFTIKNSPVITGPKTVKPDFGQQGGGVEFFTSDAVQAIINNVKELH